MRMRGRFECLFAIMCGISGVGIVIAISSIKAYTLEQELESEHVLSPTGERREQSEGRK